MANRLARESSPYLLQHRDNPVDWYPWGDEALTRARAEDKPILLSIGYSACHWCHVMAHESFEDAETADLMNRHFVPVKVDREERPDLDSIYMEAVQRLTGHGGWPMTVFLTPDGRPFFGGTYYPPVPRHGMPSFKMLLTAIADAYVTKRDDVEQSAAAITHGLMPQLPPSTEQDVSSDVVAHAAAAMATAYDSAHGGFGDAPKFPQPMAIEVLLRASRLEVPHALAMAEHSLTQMAKGGIYDHLGGGFHRYSVDGAWSVPHFEKMLYDNAQLARVYTLAFQATGRDLYRRIALDTLRYVQREMTSPEGGFYATQDADSEGREGAFFVWTPDEIEQVLGSTASIFMRVYGVTPDGNFEGTNVLYLATDPSEIAVEQGLDPQALDALLATCRQTMFQARDQRPKPALDDKIITGWNGLMLRAFATAAGVYDSAEFRATAEKNADFLLSALRRNGRLLRTYRHGEAKLNAFLEDYAFLADGLLALYESTGNNRWFVEALSLGNTMIERFADSAGGPFFSTSDDHESLINRPRDLFDNAIPAGNSVAAEVLLRLAVHTGDDRYRRHALLAIAQLQDAMIRSPLAFGRLISAADMAAATSRELAIVGDTDAPDTRALLRVVASRFDPNLVVGVASPAEAGERGSPLFTGRRQIRGHATAYLCQGYVCRTPVSEPEVLAAGLAGAS